MEKILNGSLGSNLTGRWALLKSFAMIVSECKAEPFGLSEDIGGSTLEAKITREMIPDTSLAKLWSWKMGRKCLAYAFASLLSMSVMKIEPLRAQGGSILPPDEPHSEFAVPIPPEDQMIRDIEARKRMRREIEEELHPPLIPNEKRLLRRSRSLIEESMAPRPNKMMMSETMVAPFIFTSGTERRGYTAEPTMLFHVVIRTTEYDKPDGNAFFSGLRIAPMSGKGTYKDRGGTYGFLYFGPMVGVGKFHLVNQARKNPLESEQIGVESVAKPKEDYIRTGWLASTGIALQSREAEYDRGDVPPEEDFNSGFGFDAPGVWGELLYAVTFYNTLSATALVGAQLGTNKIFAYVGMGAGFWY